MKDVLTILKIITLCLISQKDGNTKKIHLISSILMTRFRFTTLLIFKQYIYQEIITWATSPGILKIPIYPVHLPRNHASWDLQFASLRTI